MQHRFQFHFSSFLTIEYIFGKRLPKVEIPISTTFHSRGAYRRINNHQQENAEYCGLHNYKVFQHVMRISLLRLRNSEQQECYLTNNSTLSMLQAFWPVRKKINYERSQGSRHYVAQSSSKKLNVLAILGEGSTKTVQI